MRSDRYKKSEYQSSMNTEDRHDFWAGTPQGEHRDAPTKAEAEMMAAEMIPVISVGA